MPNRIIKESIRESYSIDQLSPQAEVLFYRLITFADDYGLFKGDPKLLNKALFPLKDFRDTQVILWADDVAKTGMIEFYIGRDGKPYGRFVSWPKHQTVRAAKPKYPEPENGCHAFKSLDVLLKSSEFNRFHMNSDESKCSRNQSIQSNPNPNPIRNNSPSFKEDSDEVRLSRLLFKRIQERDPKAKEPDYQKWGKSIDLLIRVDKRTREEIEGVIEWCQDDAFWCKNILSASTLREKFGRLWIQMNTKEIKGKKGQSHEGTDRLVQRLKDEVDRQGGP